jgi:DNA-binding NarL/FixJ family response regulator
MIKLALVEDNPFLTKALVEKLDFEAINIKAKFKNGKEIVEFLEKNHNFDILLMDIEMPIMNGIEATQIIKNKYPQIKIIMITVFDNDENIFNAIKAGADGYLLKDTSGEKIFEAIKETLDGGAAMTPSIAMKTLKFLKNTNLEIEKNSSELITLSDRETAVLEQLSKGLKSKDIAENLFITLATVKKHTENIYRKLQAHNRIELVQKARANRLL